MKEILINIIIYEKEQGMRGQSKAVCVCEGVLSRFSHVRLFATQWTVALQAPLSMGFSRQEYWSGLPCLTPGDLPYPESNSCLLCLMHWQVGSLPLPPAARIQMLLNN